MLLEHTVLGMERFMFTVWMSALRKMTENRGLKRTSSNNAIAKKNKRTGEYTENRMEKSFGRTAVRISAGKSAV
jgi:hypothetical protein